MIWPISAEDRSISLIAATALSTTVPDDSAWARVRVTTSLASRATPAVFRTVAVISSRAAAVSSRLAA